MDIATFTCPQVKKFTRGNEIPWEAIQLTKDNREEVMKFGPANTIIMGDKLYLEVMPEHFGYMEVGQVIVKEGREQYSIWKPQNFLNVFKQVE